MNKERETFLFWKSLESSVESMYLNPRGKDIDTEEKGEILSYLPDLKGKKILDLASGIGRFTKIFSSQASHLTTVDMIPQFVEKNKESHIECRNVTFICSDAMHLQIEDQSFDFIFLNWLFMYLEDEEVSVLMDRIQRWLKPKGDLFFRESCSACRKKSPLSGYVAHYRDLLYYDEAVKKRFFLVKEGHIKAHVDAFANPFQCFWLCKKIL